MKNQLLKKIILIVGLLKNQIIILRLLKQKIKYQLSVLTAVENTYLISVFQSKKKKTDYNTKNTEIEEKLIDHTHYKYITTPECKILTAEILDARLARANLVTQTDFHTILKSINQKITSNKTKKLLVENEFKKTKNI